MKYEYDKQKSKLNLEKHGIDFDETQNIWLDDNVIIPAQTAGEIRYMIIGKIEGKFYSCIYTVRANKIRLISCRRSRENEKKVYHEKSK